MDHVPFRQELSTYTGPEGAPKYVFRLVGDMIEAAGLDECAHLDVGCAAGGMSAYFAGRFPHMKLSGLDSSLDLLALASQRVPTARFVLGDALDVIGSVWPVEVVTCFGVLGTMERFEPLLSSLIAGARKRVYVHSLFNDANIDVRVAYRDMHNGRDWNSGFNIFSVRSVTDWLEAKPMVKNVTFHDVELDVEITRRYDSPHRAWTVDVDGYRRTLNGLCMLLPEKLLEVEL